MKPSSGETLQQQQKNVVRYLIRLCCAVFADENYTNPLAKSHFFFIEEEELASWV